MNLQPHEKLKVWRMRKGLTQNDLAKTLHCSQMEISRLERGKEPNPILKEKIEKKLQVSIWNEDGVEEVQ